MHQILRAILLFLLIVSITTVVHWGLVQLYNLWCAPLSVVGLITTLFTLGSPFCQFINYIQFELAKHYVGLWAGAAVAIIAYVTTSFMKK